MHRCYAANTSLDTEIILINNTQEIHHIRNVLRLKVHERVIIFNGTGEAAEGEILLMKRDQIAVRKILCRRAPDPEGWIHLSLACAIPKRSKFEWIIEKATELGVEEILPLKTARTELYLDNGRMDRKVGRYHAVAVNAAKQCKRSTVPTIHPVRSLEEALKTVDPGTCALIPCLFGERKGLRQAVSATAVRKVIVFIGPEGDFTREEVSATVKAGAVPISLGETVLKVETAAIAVLSFLRFFGGVFTDPPFSGLPTLK